MFRSRIRAILETAASSGARAGGFQVPTPINPGDSPLRRMLDLLASHPRPGVLSVSALNRVAWQLEAFFIRYYRGPCAASSRGGFSISMALGFAQDSVPHREVLRITNRREPRSSGAFWSRRFQAWLPQHASRAKIGLHTLQLWRTIKIDFAGCNLPREK